MSAVVQAFPSFHGVNARSFALAFIILLHLAFFWALSSGLAPPIFDRLSGPIVMVPVHEQQPVEPLPPGPVIDEAVSGRVSTPEVPIPDIRYDDSGWQVPVPPVPDGSIVSFGTTRVYPSVVVAPQIDTRRGLREPVYPAQEIRLNHTGTVLLAVEVLPNGKVGEVRMVQSSGYPRLDAAAMKAARDWRLIAGKRDGVPTAMWKEIPVTFRLRD